MTGKDFSVIRKSHRYFRLQKSRCKTFEAQRTKKLHGLNMGPCFSKSTINGL